MRENLNLVAYVSGQHIRVAEDSTGNTPIKVTWMRAGMRMTLGILLHPDRMNAADWEDIAGIGPVLARRIVSWRQKNGDFGSILRLQQVAGVGPKTITSLRPWFIPHQLPVN
ncbi:MAG: helix-hairpin-helix domain-containing protein [Desulfuromonas sp.]